MGRWTPEQTLKFAELYHGHECLWNQNRIEYRDRKLRMMAIKDIISQMAIPNFGVADVKSKIKNLRSTYLQEVHKIKQSAMFVSGTQGLYEPSMKWFDVFDSLMQSSKGYTKTLEDPLYGEEVLPEEICDSSMPDQCSEDPLALPEGTSTQSPTVESQEQQYQGNLRHKTSRRKLKIKDVISKRTAVPLPNFQSPSECDMSENEAFGRYIAKSLNNLSPLSAVLAQQEIQSVLTKFKLKDTNRLEYPDFAVQSLTFGES